MSENMDIKILSPKVANIMNNKDKIHLVIQTKDNKKYNFDAYSFGNTKHYLSGYVTRKIDAKAHQMCTTITYKLYDSLQVDKEMEGHIRDSLGGFFSSSEYQNSVMNKDVQLKFAKKSKQKAEKQITKGTQSLKNMDNIVERLNQKFNNGKITYKDNAYTPKSII